MISVILSASSQHPLSILSASSQYTLSILTVYSQHPHSCSKCTFRLALSVLSVMLSVNSQTYSQCTLSHTLGHTLSRTVNQTLSHTICGLSVVLSVYSLFTPSHTLVNSQQCSWHGSRFLPSCLSAFLFFFLPGFLDSCLPAFLHRPSFMPSFIFLPSCLPSFPPSSSFLPSLTFFSSFLPSSPPSLPRSLHSLPSFVYLPFILSVYSQSCPQYALIHTLGVL